MMFVLCCSLNERRVNSSFSNDNVFMLSLVVSPESAVHGGSVLQSVSLMWKIVKGFITGNKKHIRHNTCLNFWRVVPNITSYQNLFPEVKVGSTCMGEAYGFFHSISKRSVHYFSDWLNSFLSQRIEGKKSAVSFQGFSPYVWYGSFSWTCWGFSVNKSIYHAFFREFQKKKKSRVGNFTLACLIKKTKSSNFCSWAPCLAFTTHKYQRRCWYCSLPMTWFWV